MNILYWNKKVSRRICGRCKKEKCPVFQNDFVRNIFWIFYTGQKNGFFFHETFYANIEYLYVQPKKLFEIFDIFKFS